MAVIDRAAIQQGANIRTRRQEMPGPGTLVLGGLSFIGVMISLWMIFFYAPTEAVEGQAQRIFYVHVPMAWLGMLSFIIMAVTGIGYVIKKNERLDMIARATAEVGTVFLTITLITGANWGKTTWGTWWSWDPKLTATLIMWFMFIAYLMLRSYMGHTTTSAYAGAVLAIIGSIDVPTIYLSVQWWRGLHPQPVTNSLPLPMLYTLLVALVSFTLLYCFILLQVYQFVRLQTLAQRLRASLE